MSAGAMPVRRHYQSEPAGVLLPGHARSELGAGCCWQKPATPVGATAIRPLAIAQRSAQGRRSYQEDSSDARADLLGSLTSLPGGGGEADRGVVPATPPPAPLTAPPTQRRPSGNGHDEANGLSRGLLPLLAYAAVFDGHGGSAVAQHCKERLALILRAQLLHWCSSSGHAGWLVQQALLSGSMQDEVVSEALVHSFQECDASIPQAIASDAGSTAVCALVGQDAIWVANCGDSRAVVARKGAQAVPLSDDHKPERTDEMERIKAAGGQVFWNGGHRVMGVLGMTRAMGDRALKQYGVISTPEVMRVDRTPEDEFLLLASDGLWEVLSNAEAVGVASACVERAMERGADRPAALRVAAQVLVKAALQQGSSDNITVVLVDLLQPEAPSRPQSVQQPEQAA